MPQWNDSYLDGSNSNFVSDITDIPLVSMSSRTETTSLDTFDNLMGGRPKETTMANALDEMKKYSN